MLKRLKKVLKGGLVVASITMVTMLSTNEEAYAKDRVCNAKGDKICTLNIYTKQSPNVQGFELYSKKGVLYTVSIFNKVFDKANINLGDLKFTKGKYKLTKGLMYKKVNGKYKVYSGTITQYPNRVSFLTKTIGEQVNKYTFKKGKIEKVKFGYKY